MGHSFNIRNSALLCWKRLKNLTNGLNMWEMTYIFRKWLKYLRNVINYVGDDLDLYQMAQICREIT